MDDPNTEIKSGAATPGQRKRADELVALAYKEFEGSLPDGSDLLPGEIKMLRAATMGEVADLASEPGDKTDLEWRVPMERYPLRGPWEQWGAHRIIRATVLRWVCASKEAQALVDPLGAMFQGAWIDGEINLDGAEVPFRIGLFRCAIPSLMTLLHASLEGLHLNGSVITGIRADDVKIAGTVSLNQGFVLHGQVRFLGATIGGNLSCRGGTFNNAIGCALSADGVKVTGNVNLDDGFVSHGEIRFAGATIGRNLDCSNGTFNNAAGDALVLQEASVDGTMLFRSMKVLSGVICMAGARTGYLFDDLEAWPDHLRLTDFRYRAIYPGSVGALEDRIKWLAKHDETVQWDGQRFDPQPYRQLAKVLRHSGHDSFANDVMYTASKKSAASRILRQKDLGTLADYFLVGVLTVLNVAYILLVGHGYKRIRPFVWMVGLILLGAFVFTDGHSSEFFGDANPNPPMMQQTQGLAMKDALDGESWIADYPAFRPIAYSADAFLPLVNLHQETYWTPRDSWVKRLYLPFHILMGWIVTTLAAVSITGLVRHEKE